MTNNLRGGIFPDKIFNLLTQEFATWEEAIAASGHDSVRVSWAILPPVPMGRLNPASAYPVRVATPQKHSAVVVFNGECYYWQPTAERDREVLAQLVAEKLAERDRLIRSRNAVHRSINVLTAIRGDESWIEPEQCNLHNFQQAYAAMSDDALIAAAERDQLARLSATPPVLLIAGRAAFASHWKRLHPEVARHCRYVSDPNQLRGLRRDAILIRMNLHEQNPLYQSGLLHRFMPIEQSPIVEYDERIPAVEAWLTNILRQQQPAHDRRITQREWRHDRPAEVTFAWWDEAETDVMRPSPEQLEASLEELDRLCSSTIALIVDGRRTPEGQALNNLTHHLRTFGDPQTAEFAIALHEKFRKIQIMTPAEYRQIKCEAFAEMEELAAEISELSPESARASLPSPGRMVRSQVVDPPGLTIENAVTSYLPEFCRRYKPSICCKAAYVFMRLEYDCYFTCGDFHAVHYLRESELEAARSRGALLWHLIEVVEQAAQQLASMQNPQSGNTEG
jgi:hypothetical protein